MKDHLIKSAVILACASTTIWANCPNLSTVTYGCSIHGNAKHCNWSAPWYEGFPDEIAQAKDKASAFEKVFWGIKEKMPPQPGFKGSTICFYKSSKGSLITLVQNNWGHVEYPAGKNWKVGSWQTQLGRECVAGISSCSFNYP
jgi:hypothetical protein